MKFATPVALLLLLAGCVTTQDDPDPTTHIEHTDVPDPVEEATAYCHMRTEVIPQILATDNVSKAFMAMTLNQNVLEVYKDNEGRFIIVVTTPDGLSCIRYSGVFWEQIITGTLL